jgi:hypothetical protein
MCLALLLVGCGESPVARDVRMYRESLVRVKAAVQQNPPNGKELFESMKDSFHRFELAKPNLTQRQVKAGTLTTQALAQFAEFQRQQAARPDPSMFESDAYKKAIAKTADEIQMSIEALDNKGGFKSLRGGQSQ